MLGVFEITLFNACCSLRVLFGRQPATSQSGGGDLTETVVRVSGRSLLERRRAVMESRRSVGGRGCAGGRMVEAKGVQGEGEGGQLDLITSCPYFIAHTTVGHEDGEREKKQETDSVSTPRTVNGGRRTLSRRLATLITSPLPVDPCVFPIMPVIKADNEECRSVAPLLWVPQLH